MSLKDDKQQNIQIQLDFSSTLTGEAQKAETEAVESRPAVHAIENPASTNRLMEEVCERENLREALRRVKTNKGSPGVDGMTTDAITDYLKQGPAIRELLALGVGPRLARNTAGSSRGAWYLARAKALSVGLSMRTSNRSGCRH